MGWGFFSLNKKKKNRWKQYSFFIYLFITDKKKVFSSLIKKNKKNLPYCFHPFFFYIAKKISTPLHVISLQKDEKKKIWFYVPCLRRLRSPELFSLWYNDESDGLRNLRKRVRNPFLLLRSLSDKYSWTKAWSNLFNFPDMGWMVLLMFF